jgi:hypothetical protein
MQIRTAFEIENALDAHLSSVIADAFFSWDPSLFASIQYHPFCCQPHILDVPAVLPTLLPRKALGYLGNIPLTDSLLHRKAL